MRAQLINLLRELQSSYWFIPTLMVFAAMLLALISDRLDSALETTFLKDIPWIYQTQTSGARAVLSAIATSMIGVAGVTFSMTLVAVSFAASNIGPRLIANFMRDRGNQITLGTFIATFVYCLLILRTVTDPGDNDSTAYIPHLSILIALMLALLSVGNLIYFIHHIPESINVARIAYRIAEELRVSIQSLFPEDVGFTTKHIDPSEPLELGASFRVESQPVRMEALAELIVICKDPQRLELLTQQAQRLAKAGSESLPLSADQNELQRRCEQTLTLASKPEREREMRDSQGWLGGRA